MKKFIGKISAGIIIIIFIAAAIDRIFGIA